MVSTKLILLDGMTGMGKSTTAQRLWLHLEQEGIKARWIYEHDTHHPVSTSDERERIVAAGELDAGYIDEVLPRRWSNLARLCSGGDAVVVLEGTLLHSSVGLLLAMNVPDRAIVDHVVTAGAAITDAGAVLAYFRPQDIASTLRATFENRASYAYADLLLQYIGRTPYGKSAGLHSSEGLIGFYEHWARLVDLALAQLPLPQVSIEAAVGGWDARERQLADFLGLPPFRRLSASVERPSRFIGRYRDTKSNDELVVAGDERGLFLQDAGRTTLIPMGENCFQIEATCAEVSFTDEHGGLFRSLRLGGNLPGLSPVWTRTTQASAAEGSSEAMIDAGAVG